MGKLVSHPTDERGISIRDVIEQSLYKVKDSLRLFVSKDCELEEENLCFFQNSHIPIGNSGYIRYGGLIWLSAKSRILSA